MIGFCFYTVIPFLYILITGSSYKSSILFEKKKTIIIQKLKLRIFKNVILPNEISL